jgi:pimeloyl-ACP methyl ester carboxylesterase
MTMSRDQQIRPGRIPIRDVSLYVEIAGHGYPLLLMHGGPGADHWTMRPFRQCADRFTLIFYDHRCNGRSEGPPVSSMTWENLTADADALRERLGFERWAVLGHSFGGHVALEYALRYPGRHEEQEQQGVTELAPEHGESTHPVQANDVGPIRLEPVARFGARQAGVAAAEPFQHLLRRGSRGGRQVNSGTGRNGVSAAGQRGLLGAAFGPGDGCPSCFPPHAHSGTAADTPAITGPCRKPAGSSASSATRPLRARLRHGRSAVSPVGQQERWLVRGSLR